MRAAWAVVVLGFVLFPFLYFTATGGFSWGHLLWLVVPGVLTMMALGLGIPPLEFWTVPVAAGLPWAALLGAIFAYASFLRGDSQSAAIMGGLFPLFGLVGFTGLGILFSFFLGPHIPLGPRILWALGASGLFVAALVAMFGLIMLGSFLERQTSSVPAPPAVAGETRGVDEEPDPKQKT